VFRRKRKERKGRNLGIVASIFRRRCKGRGARAGGIGRGRGYKSKGSE
jgi:hypothetical protein